MTRQNKSDLYDGVNDNAMIRSLASIISLCILLAISGIVLGGADISNEGYTFDEDEREITVFATLSGDVDDAYVEYTVCTTDGMCLVPQKLDLVDSGLGNYTATMGPFEPGDQVKFKVAAYDSHGNMTESAEMTHTFEPDEEATGIPGFEAWSCLLSIVIALVALTFKRRPATYRSL